MEVTQANQNFQKTLLDKEWTGKKRMDEQERKEEQEVWSQMRAWTKAVSVLKQKCDTEWVDVNVR